MSVRIGKSAPEFSSEAWVRGAFGARQVSLSEYRGKNVVLFFYPRDFTFICPTEIVAFAELEPEFEKEDAVIIGASTDSFHVHKAWFETDPRLQGVKFPVLADTSHRVSEAYDVLLDDGATLRGTFIIDPDGIVRHMTVNDLDVGRNIQETLRTLQALRTGELCPVGWKPGQNTLTTYDDWLARALPHVSKQLLVNTTKKLQAVSFEPGAIIFEQGDAPDRFYIVSHGAVDIIRHLPDGSEKVIDSRKEGEFFGEIGLLTEARRTASVRAREKTELLALDFDDFRKAIESNEATGQDFSEIVQARLANIQKATN